MHLLTQKLSCHSVTYWVILCLISFGFNSAALANNGQMGQPGQSCQGCQNGGEGSEAGEILLGVAAILTPIMAAVAQISVAKTRAAADKFIAATSAAAAITQTKIQAATTKQLAQDQREVAEKNTQVTKEIAELQQSSSTQRLSMQLAVLKEERDLLAAERAEIRQIEERRAQEQIAFAKDQADQQIALQKRAALFQFAANSLALGGGGAGGAGNLGVSDINGAGRTAGAQTAAGLGNGFSSLGVTSSNSQRATQAPPGFSSAVATNSSQSIGQSRRQQLELFSGRAVTKPSERKRKPTKSPSSRLVASASNVDFRREAGFISKASDRGFLTMTPSYVHGTKGLKSRRGLWSLVGGSTRHQRYRVAKGPSNLKRFSKAVKRRPRKASPTESFSRYLEEKPKVYRRHKKRRTKKKARPMSPGRGAYKPPSLNAAGSSGRMYYMMGDKE